MSYRFCNCVGYLTNPGGRCCMDLQGSKWSDTWLHRTTKTVTVPNTLPLPVIPSVPVDEQRMREIVREEIADLPIPFDVPDVPPEAA